MNSGFWLELNMDGSINKIRMNHHTNIDFNEGKLIATYVDDYYLKDFFNFQRSQKKDDEIRELSVKMVSDCPVCDYRLFMFDIHGQLNLFGICTDNSELGIYKEMIKINSSLVNKMRNEMKKDFNAFKDKEYDEISKINNQLINAKRLLEKKNMKIQELLDKDHLTNAYSRMYLYNKFDKLVKEDTKGYDFILLDVDNFKYINDNFSHKAGDEFLKFLVKELKEEFSKKEEAVGRIGGDEFCVYSYKRDIKELKKIFASINNQVKNMYEIVSVSFGVENINTKEHESFEYYYAKSDKKMYTQKSENKERIRE